MEKVFTGLKSSVEYFLSSYLILPCYQKKKSQMTIMSSLLCNTLLLIKPSDTIPKYSFWQKTKQSKNKQTNNTQKTNKQTNKNTAQSGVNYSQVCRFRTTHPWLLKVMEINVMQIYSSRSSCYGHMGN